ncbi:hypothetical protein Val02_27060 [Virgisporangium aliadipatigenens]|uniref:Ribbon-helix-helix protein CopG domain-containing protein n=1 Tax=Virgisporangium aliadipatigenens TaxID=741659 RepID=A0A8J4DPC7_9ACTN|nr:ribbon-helix-helix protein, CopG family [Virgisporangium aliadipatigenens]GIJ45820.1 hypothetical protein Val02_27060 [Virgisporangium aliadipatigenens]
MGARGALPEVPDAVRFRLSPADLATLDFLAARRGGNRSQVLRDLIRAALSPTRSRSRSRSRRNDATQALAGR